MGVLRGDDLGQEDAWPGRWKMGECLEHPLQEKRGLFKRNILVEDVGQGIHEDDETDRLGGQQRLRAFTQERRALPASKRPREGDAPEGEVREDAAGLGYRDDRRHLKGLSPSMRATERPEATARAAVRRATPCTAAGPQTQTVRACGGIVGIGRRARRSGHGGGRGCVAGLSSMGLE
jgi:hypothetical protein